MMMDHCKRCRAPAPHLRHTDPHGREAWWCVCGASKHMLSARATPARDREPVVMVSA